MPVRQQRRIALELTPVLAELFSIPLSGLGGVNIRFHSYAPSGFAVGGKLLSDTVPLVGQVMKRLMSH